MEISRLIEAAKAEGGEQNFGALLHEHVKEESAPLVAERDHVKAELAKRKAKTDELFDELKPIRRLMTDRGIEGVSGLTEALDAKGDAPKDAEGIRKLALELAETEAKARVASAMSAELGARKELESKYKELEVRAAASDAARDDALWERDFSGAVSGKDRPEPIGFTRPQLAA